GGKIGKLIVLQNHGQVDGAACAQTHDRTDVIARWAPYHGRSSSNGTPFSSIQAFQASMAARLSSRHFLRRNSLCLSSSAVSRSADMFVPKDFASSASSARIDKLTERFLAVSRRAAAGMTYSLLIRYAHILCAYRHDRQPYSGPIMRS